jgi:hypothetical protein
MTVLDFEDEDCLKTLLIDAIIGVGFTNNGFAVQMVELSLAKFTGNQHNPEWEWCKKSLIEFNVETLKELYYICKNQDDALQIMKKKGYIQ